MCWPKGLGGLCSLSRREHYWGCQQEIWTLNTQLGAPSTPQHHVSAGRAQGRGLRSGYFALGTSFLRPHCAPVTSHQVRPGSAFKDSRQGLRAVPGRVPIPCTHASTGVPSSGRVMGSSAWVWRAPTISPG